MYSVVQNFYVDMIKRGRNAERENLLHYVCYNNQSHLIEPLLFQGFRLHEQDVRGRTPIHIAIERDHQECTLVFIKLLQSYSNLNEELKIVLRRTFQVYNDHGRTILHEAVLKNLKNVVQDMLKFCIHNDVSLAYMEVLGCGDTLLHLIVRENLLEMAQIVCELLPELLNGKNYAGLLPINISKATSDMGAILKNYSKAQEENKMMSKI